MKKNKRICELKLTQEQSIKLSKFVCSMKNKFNLDEYALISQPHLEKEVLKIVFLTTKEAIKLVTVFRKMGIANG